MSHLEGKTALVTGASRGIGRAVAERLAADGAWVAVHYANSVDAAQDVVACIERAGGRAFAIRAEFGTDGDVDTLFAGLNTGLRGRSLDILVNNAGVLDATPFEKVTAEAFDRSYAVNVRAPFFVTQRALGIMCDGGRIINISSAVTRIASPFLHYAMNKGAINAMGHTLAQALGSRGITVNTVAPGVIDTDLANWLDLDAAIRPSVTATIALGRIGVPADVADVVAFLASSDGRWVTGVTLDASGGQWLGPAAA
jgi:NAD(P)-dependent dehydrogenase (short-subunit alcohol dehydrogenase family)